jgi:hypothetical protein
MSVRCPDCGKFLSYDAYYGRWQCMDNFCGRTVAPPKPEQPGPDWKNPGIGRLLANIKDK